MIKLKDMLNESNVWDRQFGQPLPTLSDVMGEKEDCDCGGSCCGVVESVEDKNRAKKKFQSLMKHEGGFRDKMFKLEQAFLRDARPENRDAAKQLKKIYKDNVTNFMRETAKLVNKLK
jgi:hypothetical protein